MSKPYYIVTSGSLEILRGYTKIGPAKAFRTRASDPVRIFIVDLTLCEELDGDLLANYEAQENAALVAATRADALKKRVLAQEIVLPRKRSKRKCPSCRNGRRYEPNIMAGLGLPAFTCETCKGTGKVLGG